MVPLRCVGRPNGGRPFFVHVSCLVRAGLCASMWLAPSAAGLHIGFAELLSVGAEHAPTEPRGLRRPATFLRARKVFRGEQYVMLG